MKGTSWDVQQLERLSVFFLTPSHVLEILGLVLKIPVSSFDGHHYNHINSQLQHFKEKTYRLFGSLTGWRSHHSLRFSESDSLRAHLENCWPWLCYDLNIHQIEFFSDTCWVHETLLHPHHTSAALFHESPTTNTEIHQHGVWQNYTSFQVCCKLRHHSLSSILIKDMSEINT